MKKILLISMLAISMGSFAQIRKLPAVVTEAFKEKYPHADQVEWRDKLSYYLVSFLDDGIKLEARFSNRGGWEQTENEINNSDLPPAVKAGLEKSKYADWESTGFYRQELPGNKIQYRITVKKNDLQKKNLLFSTDGQLLKYNIKL